MKTRIYTSYDLEETDDITVSHSGDRVSLHDSLHFTVRISTEKATKLAEALLNEVAVMAKTPDVL